MQTVSIPSAGEQAVYLGHCIDLLAALPADSIDCCVTSPPYWGLRNYNTPPQDWGDWVGELGQEPTPQMFVSHITAVFEQVRRVLKPTGTCWMNLGDSYASMWSCGRRNAVGEGACDIGQRQNRRGNGLKEKDLVGIPWRCAFALQDAGWYLRQDIVWSKPNPMPESVRDRCTKAHEYIFLLTKSAKYLYDKDAIAEPVTESSIARLSQDIEGQRGSDRVPGKTNGTMKAVGTDDSEATRNKRSVWEIATQPSSNNHYASYPEEIPRLCIMAGCPVGGVVLDPFAGTGTTLAVARKLGRTAIGFDLNPEYKGISDGRLLDTQQPLMEVA